MQYHSPPYYAKLAGVSPDKVVGWIREGSLRAVNFSNGDKRPRWRISVDEWQRFLAARTNEAVKPKRARRGVALAAKDYFPNTEES